MQTNLHQGQNANEARTCVRAPLSPAGSAFDLATAIPVGRWPSAIECPAVPALLPVPRVFPAPAEPLARFDRLFAATFPVVQKDRQSSIASLYRRPFRSSTRRVSCETLVLRAGSGCDHIARGRNVGLVSTPKPQIRTAAPYSRAKDQDRISTVLPRRSNLAEAPFAVSLPGRFHAALPTSLAVSPACFPAFRRPRSVGWRTCQGAASLAEVRFAFQELAPRSATAFFLRDN